MARRKGNLGGALSTLTAGISTTMVLILLGVVVFFGMVAPNLSRSLKENFTVDVLLSDSLSPSATAELKKMLSKECYTKKVVYVSKAQATHYMAQTIDSDPEEFLEYSPFPASFELHLKAEYANTDSLHRYMPRVEQKFGVTEVVYPEDLMDTVNHNIRRVSLVLLIVAALLAVVSVSLINNVVRLSVARRKHSIQTMKLVGASWSFIRRPFLLNAVGMGLVASCVASGVIFAGLQSLLLWDADVAQLISLDVILCTLGSIFLFGCLLTLVCAYFSVNQQLRLSRGEAYLY